MLSGSVSGGPAVRFAGGNTSFGKGIQGWQSCRVHALWRRVSVVNTLQTRAPHLRQPRSHGSCCSQSRARAPHPRSRRPVPRTCQVVPYAQVQRHDQQPDGGLVPGGGGRERDGGTRCGAVSAGRTAVNSYQGRDMVQCSFHASELSTALHDEHPQLAPARSKACQRCRTRHFGRCTPAALSQTPFSQPARAVGSHTPCARTPHSHEARRDEGNVRVVAHRPGYGQSGHEDQPFGPAHSGRHPATATALPVAQHGTRLGPCTIRHRALRPCCPFAPSPRTCT